MAVDCLGICKYHTTFLGATLPNFEDWPKVLLYNTGLEFTPEEILSTERRRQEIAEARRPKGTFERFWNWIKALFTSDPKPEEEAAPVAPPPTAEPEEAPEQSSEAQTLSL